MASSGLSIGSGRLLADYEIGSIGAGQTTTTLTQGTLATSPFVDGSATTGLAANSILATTPDTGTRWDAQVIRATSGAFVAGTTPPDLDVTIFADGAYDYTPYLLIDLAQDSLMIPRRELVVSETIIVLGRSLLNAARRAQRGGGRPRCYATEFTGVPIAESLQLRFHSTSGIAAASVLEPPRVQVYGDVLDQAALDYINTQLGPWTTGPGGNAHISETSTRRVVNGLPSYEADFVLPGGLLTLQNFRAKPSGFGQGFVAVFRFLRFARPLLDVASGSIYGLTQVVQLLGGPNNVLQTQDLGFQYAGTSSALKLIEFGRRPIPAQPYGSLSYGAGYTGLNFGSTAKVIPDDTSFGAVVTAYDNPIPYGTVQPYREEPNLYFRTPKWGGWVPTHEEGAEVIANESAAVFIAAQNGLTISGVNTAVGDGYTPAQVDTTMVGGVLFTSGAPVSR